MLSSPLLRVGGKKSLRQPVLALLPADHRTYVEVFGGAAWLLFTKMPSELEVLNDFDADLMNIWRIIKWRPLELLACVTANQALRSRELFYAIRGTDFGTLNELERAEAFYLLLRQSFGANIGRQSSASFGTKRLNIGSLWSYRSHTMRTFLPASARLANVLLEAQDAVAVIKQYAAPDTLFFCDPPYYEQAGYMVPFEKEDHQRLARALRVTAGRWLVTINAHPFIKHLYEGLYFTELLEKRSISLDKTSAKHAPIWAISNYDPATITPCAANPDDGSALRL